MPGPSLFSSLREVVVKRRTGEGEFSYLYLPSGEAVAGKKSAFKLLKSDEACYENLKECKLDGETDTAFDARLLKLIVSVPFEEQVEEETVGGGVTETPQKTTAPAKIKTTPAKEQATKILTDPSMKRELVSKTSLSKLVARRRLEGGEFSYIYIPLEKSICGKKAMYQFLKNQNEEFTKLQDACREVGETDEEFDARMMKQLLTVPYEKEILALAMDTEEELEVPAIKRKTLGSTSTNNENKKPRFDSAAVKYVYFEGEVLRTYRRKEHVPEPLHLVQFGACEDSREKCFKVLASKKINAASENILDKLSLVKSGEFQIVYKRPKSEITCVKELPALEELLSYLQKVKGDSKLCLVTYRKESFRALTGLLDVHTVRNKFRRFVDSMVVLEDVLRKKSLKQFLPVGTLSSLYHKTVGLQFQMKAPSCEDFAELLMKSSNILMKKYNFELNDFSINIIPNEGWNQFRKGLAYELAENAFTVTNSNNFVNKEEYQDTEGSASTSKVGSKSGVKQTEIIEMDIDDEEDLDFSSVGHEMLYQVLCQPLLVKLGTVDENTKFVKFSLSRQMAGRAKSNRWEILRDSAKVFWKNDIPYAFCNLCPEIENEVRYKPVRAKIVETIPINTTMGTFKALNRTDEEQRNLSTKVLLDIVVTQAGNDGSNVNVGKDLTAVLVKLRLQPGSLTAGDEDSFELRSSDILICHQSQVKGVTIVSKFISVDRKQVVANRAKIVVRSGSHHLLTEGQVLATATLFQNDVKLVFQTLDRQTETNSVLQSSPSCAVMQVRHKQKRPLQTQGASRLYALGVNPVLVKLMQYEATRLTSKFAKAYISYSEEFDEIIDQNRQLLKIEKLTEKEAIAKVFWKKNIPYAFVNIKIPPVKSKMKVDFCDIVQNYEIGSYAPFEMGEPQPTCKITMQLCVDFEERNVVVENVPKLIKVYLKFKDAEIDKKEVVEQYFALTKVHRKTIDILSLVIKPHADCKLAPQKTSTNDMKATLLVRSLDEEPVTLSAREVIADCESLDPDTNLNKY